jgi:hypothetical protein
VKIYFKSSAAGIVTREHKAGGQPIGGTPRGSHHVVGGGIASCLI